MYSQAALAAAAPYKLPLFRALKTWQDVEVAIKLKKAIKDMMNKLKIPTLLIHDTSMTHDTSRDEAFRGFYYSWGHQAVQYTEELISRLFLDENLFRDKYL